MMKLTLRRIEVDNVFEFNTPYDIETIGNSEIIDIDVWNGGFDLIVLEGYSDPIEKRIRTVVIMAEGDEFEIDDILKTPRLIKRAIFYKNGQRNYLFELL